MPCLCPGDFSVWIHDESGNQWCKVLHVDSWELQDDVEEAPRKRTSDTNGLSQKFCDDIIGYDVEVVTTICDEDQWLFALILEDPKVLADGKRTWFFLSWDSDVNDNGPVGVDPIGLTAGGVPTYTTPGVMVYGKVRPPAFGGDNTSNDVATGAFTINVQEGPYMNNNTLVGANCVADGS